jgi:hypothetical protein
MEQNIFFVFNQFQKHSFYNAEKTCKMIFFCFYVKNGYLKKDIFYDDFFKTLPYFL